MDNLNIDERIRDTKQLVRESEALMNRSFGGHELKQEMLDKLRINLETLQKFKAEIVIPPKKWSWL